MAAKKQLDPDAGTLSEGANDWFREFLKHLEVYLAETGQGLPSNADNADLSLAAIRAVKLALLNSGLDYEQIVALFGRVALEHPGASQLSEWTAELNQRRFELIDGEIQGTLSREERLELASLTQLMRQHVDSEVNLPLEGAKKLHRYLIDLASDHDL